jgi:hypothetical protein
MMPGTKFLAVFDSGVHRLSGQGWRVSREALFWTAALVLLTWAPLGESVSLCPLDRIGFPWCPGCGIGHAMGHALRGQWAASWQSHPLGIPVLLILLQRIAHLCGFWPAKNTFPSTLSS